MGAEKALFRALKTKHDTPKYGLIYHASLIGQAAPKNKGKISRVLAAKTALAIRVDALGDSTGPTIALDTRVKVEARIRQLEGGQAVSSAGAKATSGHAKYDSASAKALAPPKFNDASDIVFSSSSSKKRAAPVDEVVAEVAVEDVDVDVSEKKKKKKKKEETVEEATEEVEEEPRDKKKKKKKDV